MKLFNSEKKRSQRVVRQELYNLEMRCTRLRNQLYKMLTTKKKSELLQASNKDELSTEYNKLVNRLVGAASLHSLYKVERGQFAVNNGTFYQWVDYVEWVLLPEYTEEQYRQVEAEYEKANQELEERTAKRATLNLSEGV